MRVATNPTQKLPDCETWPQSKQTQTSPKQVGRVLLSPTRNFDWCNPIHLLFPTLITHFPFQHALCNECNTCTLKRLVKIHLGFLTITCKKIHLKKDSAQHKLKQSNPSCPYFTTKSQCFSRSSIYINHASSQRNHPIHSAFPYQNLIFTDLVQSTAPYNQSTITSWLQNNQTT